MGLGSPVCSQGHCLMPQQPATRCPLENANTVPMCLPGRQWRPLRVEELARVPREHSDHSANDSDINCWSPKAHRLPRWGEHYPTRPCEGAIMGPFQTRKLRPRDRVTCPGSCCDKVDELAFPSEPAHLGGSRPQEEELTKNDTAMGWTGHLQT